MKSRKLITRSAAALMLAAAFALGITALLPGELQAVKIRCFCPATPTESIHGWGMSPTSCAAAKDSCLFDARANAGALCANAYNSTVCAWGSINYGPPNCDLEGGMYKVDCNQNFACDQCIDTQFP